MLGKRIAWFSCFFLALLALSYWRVQRPVGERPLRLYWFVPDGLRADPEVFNVYKWADEGKLPNFKRMMQQGAYGFSIPVFPSHTPVNFAALFTGLAPKRNGVSDGPIHVVNYPLSTVARTGFSSTAKIVDPFWVTVEQSGLIPTLLSIPGSTPPDISRGNVVRGRWGGWGIDIAPLIFHSAADTQLRHALGGNDRVVRAGQPLTEFVEAGPAHDWAMPLPRSFAPAQEVNLRHLGRDLFALIVATADDGHNNYDTVYLSLDKKQLLTKVEAGQWSDWFPLSVAYGEGKDTMASQAKLKVIKLGPKGLFRLRLLYDALNESVVQPASLTQPLRQGAGPMVDFVDNFPPQLIYYPEDKATFLEESNMSFAWHARAESYFFQHQEQDVFIQSIYSPNQMLTSRWWMGDVDPHAARYNTVSEGQRQQSWSDVLGMYKKIDQMIGAALDHRPPNGYVVLSSDHGVAPLDFEVRLNNFFAQKGWLRFIKQSATGRLDIDWAKTRVVFLSMNHVFINPAGLGGNYHPAHGAAYERLRVEVQQALSDLADVSGVHPLAAQLRREQVDQWGLAAEQVGDLVIANRPGYGWVEDISEGAQVFVTSLKAGYKQAILTDQTPALWTPFMIVGPNIKAGYKISRPISHLEQYPTVMKALQLTAPYIPDAPALTEIFGE